MTDNPTIELEPNSAAVVVRCTDDGETVEAQTVYNVSSQKHPTALSAATLGFIILNCEDLFFEGWARLVDAAKNHQEASKEQKEGDVNDDTSSDTGRTLQTEGEQPETEVAK